MLHKQANSEVAVMLAQLTSASFREQRIRNVVSARWKAEQAYREAYQWLEEHRVRFVYDRDQGCYVEVVVISANVRPKSARNLGNRREW